MTKDEFFEKSEKGPIRHGLRKNNILYIGAYLFFDDGVYYMVNNRAIWNHKLPLPWVKTKIELFAKETKIMKIPIMEQLSGIIEIKQLHGMTGINRRFYYERVGKIIQAQNFIEKYRLKEE